MLRIAALVFGFSSLALAACGHSAYAVRPIPRIAADNVGQPVSRLQDAFGAPRKVEPTSTRLQYVWFLEQSPPGAPAGFHGCEVEVTVDIRSEHVLGYSLANVGWGKCRDVQRKIRVAERP
jgi:hypothetical protein